MFAKLLDFTGKVDTLGRKDLRDPYFTLIRLPLNQLTANPPVVHPIVSVMGSLLPIIIAYVQLQNPHIRQTISYFFLIESLRSLESPFELLGHHHDYFYRASSTPPKRRL